MAEALYRVTFQYDLFVVAGDADAAERLAKLHVEDEEPTETFVDKMTALKYVMNAARDTLPWRERGRGEELTCAEFLARWVAEHPQPASGQRALSFGG